MRRTALFTFMAATVWIQSVGPAQPAPATTEPDVAAPDAGKPGAVKPGTLNLDAAKEKAAELAKLMLEAATLPVVDVHSPQQLVKFNLTAGMLSATSSVRTEDRVRIKMPEQRGVIIFSAQGTTGLDEPVSRFTFTRHDYSLPGAGISLLNVASGDGRTIIAVDAENEAKLWSIQLIQSPPPMDGMPLTEEPVRLLVRQTDMRTNKDEVDIRITAGSFLELRRRHPDEMNQYLRPIFRELGQEQFASGVDLAAAWQVLGRDWKPDDATRAKITSIVGRLGAEDFRDREKAQQELTALGQPAAIVLGNMDRAHLSPEQSAGVDSFLSSFRPLDEADARESADDPSFLIDCLYLDDLTIRKLAVVQLKKTLGKDPEIDVTADEPTRSLAAQKLRKKLIPPPATRVGS